MLPVPIATVPILGACIGAWARAIGGARLRTATGRAPDGRGGARWGACAGLVLLGLSGSLGMSGGVVARPFSEPDDRNLDRHGHYRSRDGSEVHQPAKSLDGAKPAGATAKCRDGTWSFSHTHRGTCSRHGGVAHWEG